MTIRVVVICFLVAFVFPGLCQEIGSADSTLIVAENQEAELAFNEGNTFLAKGNMNEAINSYSKAINFKPDFSKALINRAVAYTEIKEYNKAYADYDFVYNLNKNLGALYGRGISNYYLNKLEQAQIDLELAKNSGFTDPGVFYFLGVVNFELENYSDAIEFYTLCINNKADYVNAYNDRASAKRMVGDFEGAIDDYTKAIKLNPNIDFLYNNLASVYWKSGKLDQAILNYSLAIRINTNYYMAFNNLASVKTEKGDFEGAILDCNQAIKIKPEYAYAYNNRGNAKVKLEQFDVALADFNKSIELKNDFAAAYLNRGICKELTRDFEGAVADWQKAYDLGIKKALNYIQFYD
ncbi:MAG: tetratricopeptide repeat protein [Salinivirgaceae bacterium]|nr:tetratricopeptide repeat protein [Salinivirgaceae bacterium]